MNNTILIVDDEDHIRVLLQRLLSPKGYHVDTASSGTRAIELFGEKRHDLVITDLKMPGIEGEKLIPLFKEISPLVDIIVMSAYGTIQTAVKCIEIGAASYIFKPLNLEQVSHNVQILFGLRRHGEEERKRWEEELVESSFYGLIGKSLSMQRIYETIKTVGPADIAVLIEGESGTGKELVAWAIHRSSRRKDRRFVAINCGALSESLLLSELFGHKKGSFTGAFVDKKGLIEEAEGGTVYLDEISEASPSVQISLLRILEEQTFRPVGETTDLHADIRIIASTGKRLLDRVNQDLFRLDLFYRLNVVNITLPALRERKQDIPLLAHYFLKNTAAKQNKAITDFSPRTMSLLMEGNWPGNVRELENVIARAVAFCKEGLIQPHHLQTKERQIPVPEGIPFHHEGVMPLAEAKRIAEASMIRTALGKTGWSKKKTSDILRINPVTLWKKMKAYGITKPR